MFVSVHYQQPWFQSGSSLFTPRFNFNIQCQYYFWEIIQKPTIYLSLFKSIHYVKDYYTDCFLPTSSIADCQTDSHQWCILIWISRHHDDHSTLTHWGRDKMAVIFLTTFSNGFSLMKKYEFRLKFHWTLFLWVQLTISSTGSDNRLAPTRRQAIIWTNGD